MLFKNIVFIGYQQGISVDPHNVAHTTGHVARAAGGESNLYFIKDFYDFLELWREGKKKEGGGNKSCELNGS